MLATEYLQSERVEFVFLKICDSVYASFLSALSPSVPENRDVFAGCHSRCSEHNTSIYETFSENCHELPYNSSALKLGCADKPSFGLSEYGVKAPLGQRGNLKIITFTEKMRF